MNTETLASTILETLNNNNATTAGKLDYIKAICECQIYEANRDKVCTKTEKKRIKAIEKLLDNSRKVNKDIGCLAHVYEREGKAYYTNSHILAIIPAENAENIKQEYKAPEDKEFYSQSAVNRVIPQFINPVSATVTYGELVGFRKVKVKEKKNNDIWFAYAVQFEDNTLKYFNVDYLIHACEVLGLDKLTLWSEAGKTLTSISIDENNSKIVISPMRITKEEAA